MRSSLLLAGLTATFGFAVPASAQEKEGLKAMVNSSEVVAKLNSGRSKQELKGRIAILLESSERSYEQGKVGITQLNLVFRDANQALLTNKALRQIKKGNLAFSLDHKKPQALRYNAETNTLQGKVRGNLSFSALEELYPIRESAKQDSFNTPLQAATANIVIKLKNPIKPQGESLQKVVKNIADIQVSLNSVSDRLLKKYTIGIELKKLVFEFTWFWRIHIFKKLCVQPVRFRNFGFDPDPTGDGWAFGVPGMETQWRKASVIFDKRPFITITAPALKTVSNSETGAVRATVNSWDCVEVFFAGRFSPQAMFGGGASWFGGTADTKIISTDENADFGVDLTHLAHEIGHSIDLHHPGFGFPATSSSLQDSNTGTLMCPSGFNNDNPPVNSVQNAQRVNNPLFTFVWRFVQSAPSADCQNNSDCGACP